MRNAHDQKSNYHRKIWFNTKQEIFLTYQLLDEHAI
jgi:hypothetical protein